MSVENVRNFFIDRGLPDPVFMLSDSGATVELAARTLGVEPAYIAKTLAFRLRDRNILIVARGNAKIDNRKYKRYFQVKAKLLNHVEVETVTGHPVGGLCPFGLERPLAVYLDSSIKDLEFVYPAAGSRYTALKISPQELQRLTDGVWVDVCQDEVNLECGSL